MSTTAASTALKRDELILSHLPQVRSLAIRTLGRCPSQVTLDDLVSAGTIGLIQAVDRYDPRRNRNLKTFANHRIHGAILDYLRELDPLSRDVRRFQRKRDAVCARATGHLGCAPGDAEVAHELRIPLAKYRQLDRAACAGSPISLDAHIAVVGERALAGPDPVVAQEKADQQRLVHEAIQSLSARQQFVLNAVWMGATLAEIACQLHVNESRVSQIKTAAVTKLRILLRPHGAEVSQNRRRAA